MVISLCSHGTRKQTRQLRDLFSYEILMNVHKNLAARMQKTPRKGPEVPRETRGITQLVPRCRSPVIYSHNLLLFMQFSHTLKETKQGLILVIVPLCTNYFY